MQSEANDVKIIRQTTRRAATPHKCCMCRHTIATGEVHEEVVMIEEGTLKAVRVCGGH